MSRIMMISGDFLAGEAEFRDGMFILRSALNPSRELNIPISKLKILECSSEEIVTDKGSAIRWGLAGSLVLGPVGLVTGLLLCGKVKQVTFYAQFKNGQRFLATTDSETYAKISAIPLK